ncbi:hypothetical protein SAMD00019534_126500, partial [Acytostelium subglobosum LB1]|uniref:hypothetical protein n=1 Tax=Acytostelium subglobosum LB1 TaxID=1410327 RepID=UPI0006448133
MTSLSLYTIIILLIMLIAPQAISSKKISAALNIILPGHVAVDTHKWICAPFAKSPSKMDTSIPGVYIFFQSFQQKGNTHLVPAYIGSSTYSIYDRITTHQRKKIFIDNTIGWCLFPLKPKVGDHRYDVVDIESKLLSICMTIINSPLHGGVDVFKFDTNPVSLLDAFEEWFIQYDESPQTTDATPITFTAAPRFKSVDTHTPPVGIDSIAQLKQSLGHRSHEDVETKETKELDEYDDADDENDDDDDDDDENDDDDDNNNNNNANNEEHPPGCMGMKVTAACARCKEMIKCSCLENMSELLYDRSTQRFFGNSFTNRLNAARARIPKKPNKFKSRRG